MGRVGESLPDLEARHVEKMRLGEQKLRKNATWRSLWSVLRRLGHVLEASWAVSGGVLALLVASRGALGTILGPSWRENGAKLA